MTTQFESNSVFENKNGMRQGDLVDAIFATLAVRKIEDDTFLVSFGIVSGSFRLGLTASRQNTSHDSRKLV